jgi:hypothetical protein
MLLYNVMGGRQCLCQEVAGLFIVSIYDVQGRRFRYGKI